MTAFELYQELNNEDQNMVVIYYLSGIAFMIFWYLIYYCKYTNYKIRIASSTLMLGIGFMLLSTGGKILKGGVYDLYLLTQGAVILCTMIALWVVIEFLRWNKKKQIEKGVI